VVNVQGDEPQIEPALIDSVAALLEARPEASMSTAAHEIESVEEFTNTNVVKVVLDAKGLALYFSRAPIAWWRDGVAAGINGPARAAALCATSGSTAIARAFLREFLDWLRRRVEVAEALEQLRASGTATDRRARHGDGSWRRRRHARGLGAGALPCGRSPSRKVAQGFACYPLSRYARRLGRADPRPAAPADSNLPRTSMRLILLGAPRRRQRHASDLHLPEIRHPADFHRRHAARRRQGRHAR
jgi:hypothetical protein